jgi:putative transposase
MVVLCAHSTNIRRPENDVGAPLVGAHSTNIREAGTRPAPTDGTMTKLGDIVGAFKSITTDQFIVGVRNSGWPPFVGKLWQRNYYEHIIRGDDDLDRIRQYIIDNPVEWAFDRENPDFVNNSGVEARSGGKGKS